MISVRVAYSALGAGHAPVWTAKEAGNFAEEELDAEIPLIRGRCPEAVMTGEVEFAHIAAPGVVAANLKGGDIVFLAGALNHLIQRIVTRSEIQTPEQLRGRTLGIGHPGSIDSFLIPYLLQRNGLQAGVDVKTFTVDSQPVAIEKILAGEIDGALFSFPYAFEATKAGLRTLIDSGEYRIDYQLDGLIARRSFIAHSPDLTRKVVRGYVRGIHSYKTNPALVVSLLRKYSLIEDETIARQTHAALDHYFPQTPYPSVPGIRKVIEEAAKRDPAASRLRVEDLTDARWISELDKSGFIRSLYEGSGPREA